MAQQIAALRTAEQNVSHELLTPLFLLRTHAIPVERSARGDTGAAAALNAYLHHAPWSRIALS
jgi:hypothetical protein